MTDLAEPVEASRPQEGLLARALAARVHLSWEMAAYAALLAVAAGLRFWDLGARAIHHDESIHGWYAWMIYRGDGYHHDPLAHGPFQFFGMALSFLLFGASDYTFRILPALGGSALVLLPFFLRHRLGRLGAFLVAAGIAFSPTLLFFSRFARNDIYMAFYTLGLVVCLWRYVDERKPRYLVLSALLLGLSFATKENSYLEAAIFIAFLDIWLAVHFCRQLALRHRLDRVETAVAFLFIVPVAWALAALWPFSHGLRRRLGLDRWHPAGDLLLVLGALALPQFAAGIQVPLEAFFDISDADLARPAGFGKDSWTRENILGFSTIVTLVAATAVVGLRWNWRQWLLVAAAFYIPYLLLYTSFLTSMEDYYSGQWRSLDYWLAQQDVRRGNQPWFYYLMLLPAYEFLPLVLAAPALFYYAIRGDRFERFLVYWAVATQMAYMLAGEKMPWITVHTSLPVIVLGGYALGKLLAANAVRDLARGARPYVPPLILWLLRPLAYQRLAAVGVSAVAGALLAFTVFIGIRAAFQLGDDPREIFVYAQNSYEVSGVAQRIDDAARVSGLGLDLPIVVNGFEPWEWYLREYGRRGSVSWQPNIAEDFRPPAGAVVLMRAENEGVMQPFLDGYAPPIPFTSLIWFPEFDSYKTLPSADRNVPDLSGGFLEDLGDFVWEFAGGLFQASTWERWWDYLRYRDPGVPLSLNTRWVAYFPTQYLAAPPGPAAPTPTPAATLATARPLAADLVIGRAGSGPGEFSSPGGLALDAQGNLYVADTFNHRIQKFDPQGRFLAQAGGPGHGSGQFNEPWGLAVDARGNLYVADTFNHRIQKFDPDLRFVLAWGRPATSLDRPERDAFWGPRDVAVDGDGYVWVSDGGTGRVLRFLPDGSLAAAFGGKGNGPGQFLEPTAIEIAANGDIFVADSGNRRVQRFDGDFRFLAQYEIPGWLYVSSVAKPYLALLSDGGLIASDPTQDLLLRLDRQGAVVAAYTSEGQPLQIPRGLALAEGGRLYVAEAASNVVRRLLLPSDGP